MLEQPEIRTDENGEYFFFAPETIAAAHPLDAADEGELSVDVFETENEIIVQSTIAGAKTENLEISFHNDMLTIRGSRQHEIPKNGRLLWGECYWGPFSRSIILPAEVKGDEATAILRSGVLNVILPKRVRGTIPVEEIE
jgi:HSP20 family molecular chaperone IbpA